jgi:hypothetical protein
MDRLELLISINSKYEINTFKDTQISKILLDDFLLYQYVIDPSEYVKDKYRHILSRMLGLGGTTNGSTIRGHLQEAYRLTFEEIVLTIEDNALPLIIAHHLTDDELLELKLLIT